MIRPGEYKASETGLHHMFHTLYAHFPEAFGKNCLMIGAFVLVGVSFYFLFVPGRRFSLRAALGYVFRRDFYRHRTSHVDVLHFFLAIGFWLPAVGAVVAALFSIDTRDLLTGWFGQRTAVLQQGWMIALIQFVTIFVCRDFGSYIGHYLLHKIPILWSVHRAHHSAEVLTFLTSARTHPLESFHMQFFMTLSGGLGGGVLLYFTGTTLHPAPIALLLLTAFFTEMFGLAQHSHIPISFGKLSYFWISPVMHQIHHSAELRHRDRNFSTQLAVFDWLFGTIYVPREQENYRWGLNDDELGENNPHIRLRDFYLEPTVYAWHLLTGRLRDQVLPQQPPSSPA